MNDRCKEKREGGVCVCVCMSEREAKRDITLYISEKELVWNVFHSFLPVLRGGPMPALNQFPMFFFFNLYGFRESLLSMHTPFNHHPTILYTYPGAQLEQFHFCPETLNFFPLCLLERRNKMFDFPPRVLGSLPSQAHFQNKIMATVTPFVFLYRIQTQWPEQINSDIEQICLALH